MNKKNREKRKQKIWRSFAQGYINGIEVFKHYLTCEVEKSNGLTVAEINNAIDRTQKILSDNIKEKIGLEINFIRG